ncbi:MAG: uroporphyrinogen decarboxylase family protein [Kiritimatiellales bacterium]
MNSRERFAACCAHQSPDRPPVDYLAHYKTDEKLKAHLGVSTEIELLNALGADFFYLPGRDLSQREGILKYYKHATRLAMTETERTCPLGIRWKRGAYATKFAVDSAIRGPLENTDNPQDVLNFPWPKASDFDFSPLRDEARANANRVRVGGFWSGILGDVYRMHGFQNFLMNIAVEPEFIHTLIDRMTDMYLELNEAVFAEMKGDLDVWFFGNDFGSQEALLISPGMWEEFFFENIKRLCNLAHGYGIKTMMHSCGAIRPIIPRLIEAGVDILDPIQVTAKGMVPAELKTEFGNRIVFHGGIDTQNVLPFGTQAEVCKHVQETVGAMGAAGGYIFAPSQILGPDIPVENIVTMYKTIREIR